MLCNSLPVGLVLVHANQPESLRDLLVEWMRRYPLAPLENEVILVQSNGIAQWLKLALAADNVNGGCGIAAGLTLSLPSQYLWQVYRDVLGREAVPESSPYDKPRLSWRLMRLLPEVMTQPEYKPLQRFLENDIDRRKRFQLAERLADLFDQYQVYRADWLAAWAEGKDVLVNARGDHKPLAPEQRWQAALWRALAADIEPGAGEESHQSNSGRAAVHEAFLHCVEHWPEAEFDSQRPAGLPRRIMVFGISSLPRQSLEVLAAIGRWTQVLICVHNPCEHYWADIVADKDLLRAEQARQSRRKGSPALLTEELLHLHAHPLLAAWGKQGRDFIGLLDEHDSDKARAGYLQQFLSIQQRTDLFNSPGNATLLHQLQDDILDLRPLAETQARWSAINPQRDASIRFHIAHSAQREVEVLHDYLLAAFNADASLLPRDIIVMVPDIDVYAPSIRAVFGLLEKRDTRYIPFSLADQGRRHFDPLIHAFEMLLGLPQSRLAVSDLLDLLEVPAVRQRFGIAEVDLPRLHQWVRAANIRWGLHAEQRASLDLPQQHEQAAQNTWAFGLRRMLLGYAVGADAADWQGIEPYDEIGGLDAVLLGPMTQFVDSLEGTWRALREPATVRIWCERLRQLMADFFCTESTENNSDAYTLQELEIALQRWQVMCDEAKLLEALPLSVVGDYWLSQLDEKGLTQRFFGGAVTFATLMPMRAIPFRHVCLLGMNDGDYPRTRIPMDFDLMGLDYRPGDRSRREDDRYLFLEALLSARDCLHISWIGRSINDNTPRPPSVLVGQLLDHLASGWRLDNTAENTENPPHKQSDYSGKALLAAMTVEHRLQPFSLDYFSMPPLFTYAHEWRQQAPCVSDKGEPENLPLLQREEPLTLRELGSFLKSPVRAFFQQRLNVFFEQDNPASEDLEPFVLDGLSKWHLQEELIHAQQAALLRGASVEEARETRLAGIQRRGDLAVGGFGHAMAAELVLPMQNLFERYSAALARWPQRLEDEEAVSFRVTLSGQRLEIADWVGDIRLDEDGQRGRVILETSDVVKDGHYRGEKVIHHWVTHLALNVAGCPLSTRIVSKVGEIEFKPLDCHQSEFHLTTLLAAWQQGMCRPLPLAVKTAFAWLGSTKEEALRVIYEGGVQQHGELDNDVYLQRAYPDFDALLAQSDLANSEFAALAKTLLAPLQAAMPAKS